MFGYSACENYIKVSHDKDTVNLIFAARRGKRMGGLPYHLNRQQSCDKGRESGKEKGELGMKRRRGAWPKRRYVRTFWGRSCVDRSGFMELSRSEGMVNRSR